MRLKKFTALLMAALLLFGVLAMTLASCGEVGGNDPCDHNDADNNKICDSCGESLGGGSDDPTPPPAPGKVTYTVTIKSFGGMAIKSARLYAYAKGADGNYNTLVNYGVTNDKGVASFEVDADKQVAIKIQEVPEGYLVEDQYVLNSSTTTITLASKVITDNTNLVGVNYKLGSIMRDFTVTTVDGETWTLSEVLKEKDMVLINFWYTTCSACLTEFPYMEQAYEEFGGDDGDVAILALNNYGESVQDIKDFMNLYSPEFGMPYDVAVGGTDLSNALVEALGGSWKGWPTSFIIDRYGMISYIEVGALPSVKPFRALFEHFTAANYQQTIINSVDELMPLAKPDVEMPDSADIEAAINTEGTNVSYRSEDEEYAWPFVLETVEHGDDTFQVLMASNAFYDNSYAAIHLDMYLKAGDVLAFKAFSSTERAVDILYVIVDNAMITSISGQSSEWQDVYAYVADESRDHTITFVYQKDGDTDFGNDTVYIKDVRICTTDDIDTETYIPRFATTRDEWGEFGDFADVVLGTDGYYHVGTADGPLLFADFFNVTPHSDETVLYNYLYLCLSEETPLTPYYEKFVLYAQYSSNGKIYGLCPVTEELKSFLDITIQSYPNGEYNENSWLQFCKYYEAYGTDGKQLDDPIKGLSPHSAFDTVVNGPQDPVEYYPNHVVYETYFVPRGYFYEFIPETSGVYRIVSNSKEAVIGWIFLENRTIIYEDRAEERFTDFADPNNVNMIMHFEAGVKYYIDIAFFSVEATGSFSFKIEYIGENYEMLKACSPGASFTYEVDAQGNVTDVMIHGGIDAAICNRQHCDLCEAEAELCGAPEGTKYWHAVNRDGSLGSLIYADFTSIPSFVNLPIYVDDSIPGINTTDLIDRGAFRFNLTAEESEAIHYLSMTEAELRALWGDNYEAQWEAFQSTYAEEIAAIKAAGGPEAYMEAKHATDYTWIMLEYVEKMHSSANSTDERLYGCVAVDEQLGEILQLLVSKYTFSGVEEAFLKLCYYFHNY